jgi:molybdenum cofactor cytidylyltransferase
MKDEQSDTKNIGVIVLAAGASSRMGSPKQLLSYKSTNLLQHTLDAAEGSTGGIVLAILGAHSSAILKEIKNSGAHFICNPDWEEGMGASIRYGINSLMSLNPQTEAAMLLVADQPFVTTALLNELMGTYRKEKKGIIACDYGETYGPPVLFDKNYFPELLQLKGDSGAKRLVQIYKDDTIMIAFPEGVIDIDTKEDYRALSGKQLKQ